MLLAARMRSPALIFAAAGLALILSSLIGVIFREALTRLIPGRYIQIGAGAAFVLIGGFLRLGRAS